MIKKIVENIKGIIVGILVFGGIYLFFIYAGTVSGISNKDSFEIGTIGFVITLIILFEENKPKKKNKSKNNTDWNRPW